MMWTNSGLPLLINAQITEYDIRSGNTSMMRTYQLAEEDKIEYLESLSKERRVIQVGLMQQEDRQFAKKLESSFEESVKKFLDSNGLDIDVDVLAIRRDAVFVVNHPISNTQIGDHIKFRPKNVYHAALQIGPKLEFYFGKDKTDIKNFVQEKKDTEHALEKLKPGMISFLEEFVETAEGYNMDRYKVYRWIRDFASCYKDRSLDVEYYREFTREALFRLTTYDTMMDSVPDYLVDDIDISFNYRNIIIPLLQILI